MWLPRDERRLLGAYYRLVGELETSHGYWSGELAKLLDDPRSYPRVTRYGAPGEAKSESEEKEGVPDKDAIRHQLDLDARLRRANTALVKRGLVHIEQHLHETGVLLVMLTLDGYDLGRRYANFWDRSGLWFREQKDHWVWALLAFAGGLIGAIIVEILRTLWGGSTSRPS